MLHSLEISPLAKIGKGLIIAHSVGIVIGKGVKIGRSLTIYQNVTIGSKKDEQKDAAYPVIGDNVTIYPGSVIIGGVTIGDNAIIGANSVVLSHVPANATAVGSPARIIQQKKEQ